MCEMTDAIGDKEAYMLRDFLEFSLYSCVQSLNCFVKVERIPYSKMSGGFMIFNKDQAKLLFHALKKRNERKEQIAKSNSLIKEKKAHIKVCTHNDLLKEISSLREEVANLGQYIKRG